MSKISNCLWFDSEAEEAARYYVSVFENATFGEVTYYNQASSEAGKRPVGSVMSASFEIDGSKFLALNGGPPL